MVKETQRFGDICLLLQVECGSENPLWCVLRTEIAFIFGQTTDKTYVYMAHHIRLPHFPLSEDGDGSDPLEAVRFLA